MTPIKRLVAILSQLRGPKGCPWDQKQTHQTLKSYLIEETYEFLDALESKDDDQICEELGDVLLQVVFHAQIAQEEKRFTLDDVAEKTVKKLIRRHPHIFGETILKNTEELLENWETIKSREKPERGIDSPSIEGIPRHLPALLRAAKIQEKAKRVGFEWSHTGEVVEKVREEIEEFLESKSKGNPIQIEEEFGDLLFSLVNLSRFLDIQPEEALGKTIQKFLTRFTYIESELKVQGKDPKTATLKEMDYLWEKAKSLKT